MTFAAFPPLELSSSFFLITLSFWLHVSTCTPGWSIDTMEAFSPPVEQHGVPTLTHTLPLALIFPLMMQDIEPGLDTSESSSESQHPVIKTRQTVLERMLSGVRSFAQKVKQKLLGASQDLCKGFRRPRLIKEAPNLKQSIRAVLCWSCESLPGCLFSLP